MVCEEAFALIVAGDDTKSKIEIYTADGSCNKEMDDFNPGGSRAMSMATVDGVTLVCKNGKCYDLDMEREGHKWKLHSNMNTRPLQ